MRGCCVRTRGGTASTRPGERPGEEPGPPAPGSPTPASRTRDSECLSFKNSSSDCTKSGSQWISSQSIRRTFPNSCSALPTEALRTCLPPKGLGPAFFSPGAHDLKILVLNSCPLPWVTHRGCHPQTERGHHRTLPQVPVSSGPSGLRGQGSPCVEQGAGQEGRGSEGRSAPLLAGLERGPARSWLYREEAGGGGGSRLTFPAVGPGGPH